jgi:hypothetical protein
MDPKFKVIIDSLRDTLMDMARQGVIGKDTLKWEPLMRRP